METVGNRAPTSTRPPAPRARCALARDGRRISRSSSRRVARPRAGRSRTRRIHPLRGSHLGAATAPSVARGVAIRRTRARTSPGAVRLQHSPAISRRRWPRDLRREAAGMLRADGDATDLRRARPSAHAPSVAGAADPRRHRRSLQLLGQRLSAGARREPRPLFQAPVAGGSAHGGGDAAHEASHAVLTEHGNSSTVRPELEPIRLKLLVCELVPWLT